MAGVAGAGESNNTMGVSMIEVTMSDQSVAAARELDQLDDDGQLFTDDGVPRSDPDSEAASSRFLDALGSDIVRDLGDGRPRRSASRLLNPNPPPGRRHGGHGVSAMVVADLGGGWCAFGHYGDGACWFDGIGRC